MFERGFSNLSAIIIFALKKTHSLIKVEWSFLYYIWGLGVSMS